MTLQHNLAVALGLARAGLAIFPVRVTYNPTTGRWEKRPCEKEYQEKATTDEAEIRRLWSKYPEALPGIALGRVGLIVLDADRHGGPDGVSAFHALTEQNDLPAGVVEVNTAGDGEHYIFRNLSDGPLGNREGVLPGGINMRGRGGFIVAPGAMRADGKLWIEKEGGPKLTVAFAKGEIPQIPPWIVEMICPSNPGSSASLHQPSGQRVTSREWACAQAALQEEVARVAAAPPGQRNETLNKSAFSLGTMAGAGWIEQELIRDRLFVATADCGLVKDDGAIAVRATIESGLRAGLANPRAPLPNPEGGFGTIVTIGAATNKGRWDELDMSYGGSGRSKPPPFPIDLLGPFWGGWCLAHASARNAPVDYVVAGVLGSASALIGNARWVRAGPEWAEPPVLWIEIVGLSTDSKSPALDPTLSIVRRIEHLAIEASRPAREAQEEAAKLAAAKHSDWERRAKEALKSGEKPPPFPADAAEPDRVPLPRVITNDTTPESINSLMRDNPKGLLLFRDELAGWVGAFGRYSTSAGGEREMWIEAYGGRPRTIDRKKDPEPTIIPHFSISVLGGIQPDKLKLITGGADDGFAARFLSFWPEPVADFHIAKDAVDGTDQLLALRRLYELALVQDEAGIKRPCHVPISDAATAVFEEYGAELKRRARDAIGLFASSLGKAPGHVLRLALVLEYLTWSEGRGRSEPTHIDKTAMLSAIGLVDGYFLPMAQRVFGEASIPEDERKAMVLARWIARERPLHFNRRYIQRSIGGELRETKDITKACEVLTQAGWIRPIENKSTRAGGRPRSDYEVNPAVHSMGKAA